LISAPQLGEGQMKTVLQALHQYFPFFISPQTGHLSMKIILLGVKVEEKENRIRFRMKPQAGEDKLSFYQR